MDRMRHRTPVEEITFGGPNGWTPEESEAVDAALEQFGVDVEYACCELNKVLASVRFDACLPGPFTPQPGDPKDERELYVAAARLVLIAGRMKGRER